MATTAMPHTDHDSVVHIIRALDPETRMRLKRMASETGIHPFRLAAILLHDILADDEAAEGIPPPGTSVH
jgi:hypothetical protein